MAVELNNGSSNSREIDYSSIPISAFKSETRDFLSALLDPPKIILTDEGIPRDWRGLAHLTGISSAHVPSLMISDKPTATVLYRWSQKGPQEANVKRLQEFLQKIDRYDILDDAEYLFESDSVSYLSSTITKNPLIKSGAPGVTDNEIITKDDAILAQRGIKQPQFYDTFVLYADEDVEFVLELVQRMEGCGFKLCLKDRDLLGGISSHHVAIMKLIAERCHRLLIILSPAFIKSPINNFIMEFAMIGGIQERKRKMIPCVYEMCEIPRALTGYFLLFYKQNGLVNFWDKLRDSLLLSPSERLALVDGESTTTTVPSVIQPETIQVFPLKDENIETVKQNCQKHPTFEDNSEENNQNTASASLSAKSDSQPSVDTKQNKNLFSRILKLGQSSSKHLKLKKKKKLPKTPVLAS